ncbi:MarC family protein [Porticoccaceae bacterium LTM1]|nr:MarC family protein [Porticoccaceae bacterium LTM1]
MSSFIWQDIFTTVATLFFIMDPLGVVPLVLSMLKRFDDRKKRRIIIRELVFALIILLGILFAGNSILGFLGLQQPTLNIAGGILLFIIAIRMVFPPETKEAESAVEDPFIVPLAMPMLAGPSAIAVLLLLSTNEPERIWEWTTALVIAWGLTAVILLASPFLLRILGNRGLRAVERLMGMLLILISIQMFLNGVSQYLGSLS